MTRRENSHSYVSAPVGPMYCVLAGLCPPLHAEGLGQADRDISHLLGRFVGSPLSDEDWKVASLGVANGGVGARSALEHAELSSVSGALHTYLARL